ncbi:MAG: hypothetical protein QOI38_2144 [Sphingomonadales bacterium]|nr:hypothetical protein [Sphingomonadales bacterium]
MRSERVNPNSGEAAGAELVWLLGQPHLADYLDFVTTKAVGGASIPTQRLADEWRAANDYYYELEQSEAGDADRHDCRPLPPEMRPLARKVKAHPWFREAFGTLPSRIMMVELDRLIVSQTHIERPFSDALCGGLGPAPDPEALFRFCLPLDRPSPPVRVQRLSSDRYLFASGSTDFRAHAARLMGEDDLKRLASFGPISSALVLPVGFGCNFMSAVRSGGRAVLQNGYHRAYALRALGISHAPCIVTDVTRKDELKVAAGEPVSQDPEFYFAAKRPPLLRDYFDPRILRVLPIVRMETVIEIEFKVRTSNAADC